MGTPTTEMTYNQYIADAIYERSERIADFECEVKA